jgi:hypothetical protein
MIRALTTRRTEMAPFLLLFPAIATMLFVVACRWSFRCGRR